MAVTAIVKINDLDTGLILTPERYHPLRKRAEVKGTYGSYVGDIINIVSKTLSPKSIDKSKESIYLLDTGDVVEGRIRSDKSLLTSLNSSKKILDINNVIISRLRPYLRQVGYVDEDLIKSFKSNAYLVCSTEFYVLNSKNSESIAFLVPFLLSTHVQELLSISVEGSQHPRFNEDVLLSLVIPETIISQRDIISNDVENAIRNFRSYEVQIQRSINQINSLSVFSYSRFIV